MFQSRKITKKLSRALCAVIALLLLCGLLSGCKSRPLAPSEDAERPVGTVGKYSVPYEELYFLANNYDKDGMSEDELWSIISENIITGYAILALCEDAGVDIDDDELDDAVQSYIDSVIESDFDGSRSKYIDSLEDSAMTDSYVRFTVRVELLYNELELALAKKGVVATEDKDVIAYIKKNFVRTQHFMIANNAGDDVEKNLANAQSSLSKLTNGSTSMYDLIGGALNEDLLPPPDGYAFARGSMEKAYEDAAFALEIGEYSGIVAAKGSLANGEYVDCYYIIQRLELDDNYIDDNFSSLYDSYVDAVIVNELEKIKSELGFTPNEYALSLDIKDLEDIDAGTDVFAIVIICVCIAVAVITTVTVILVIRHSKKKKVALLAQKQGKAALRGGRS